MGIKMGFSFNINAPSDLDANHSMWRDARVKNELQNVLVDKAGIPTHLDADLEIYLWGWINRPIIPSKKKVLWVVSHPDKLLMHIDEIRRVKWDAVLCSSEKFTERLLRYNLPVAHVVCPPPVRPGFIYKPTYDLGFVGNADPGKGRDIFAPLFKKYNSNVAGGGWEGHPQETSWVGCAEVWNSAKVVLYSHHKDMSREHFVADALLDILANSGAAIVADLNGGYRELGLDLPILSFPTFDNDLEAVVKRELKQPTDLYYARKKARTYNYSFVAEKMLEMVKI